MRILIVKLSSIGDVVHTLPVLAAIKQAMPGAEISWVVERRAAEILEDNPHLDRLVVVDTKALRRRPLNGQTRFGLLGQQVQALRTSTFDVAIDFQGLFKSAMIARVAGARGCYGFSAEALREPLSRFLLTRTFAVPSRTHVISKNLALAAHSLNIAVPHQARDFAFPIAVAARHQQEAETVISNTADAGGRYAVLNPSGGWPTKLWSPQRYALIVDRLWTHHNLRSIVTYGPGEQALAESVTKASRTGRAQTANLSLKGFYALAERAAVYVGGDTGPTHLAVAAGAPVVGVFGPTEWWRNGSPHLEDVCVERTDIGCRTNCHRRSCSQWVCMDIETERVFAAVSERLQRVDQANRQLETTKNQRMVSYVANA